MISEHDQKLIDDAAAQAKARTDAFFKRHGLTQMQVDTGDAAYKAFLSREAKADAGKNWFNSPLGRKAFIIGFHMGRS